MVSKGFRENSWSNYPGIDSLESNENSIPTLEKEHCHVITLTAKDSVANMERNERGDVVRLPSDMDYLGHYPEFSIINTILKCKFCNQSLMPQALKGHIERCRENPNPGKNLDTGIKRSASSGIGPDGKPVGIASDYRYKYEIPAAEIRYKYKRPATEIDIHDFGHCDRNDSLMLVRCKYCGCKVKPSCLNAHLGLHMGVLLGGIRSSSSFPVVNSFAQSEVAEVDTSSSNSSPIWESDKNNVYDSCLSSSSSNSVNIVRLKQEKPKCRQKNNVIQFLLSGPKSDNVKTVQEPVCIKQEPVCIKQEPSTPPPQSVSSPPKHSSSPHPTTVLPMDTSSSMSTSCSTPDTLFECQPYFEAVQPSTSFQESSSDNGKSKLSKLIIRRVPPQNPNEVRRISVEKDQKNNSRADNLRCFLVTEEENRPQNMKTSKHQIKKKICETREEKKNQVAGQNEYIRASEQQIAFLTGRIETLNRQIETLTGQVGPLRLENEEYKAEIRNLRCRVEELENNTSTLIEQRNLRAKNDKKIEELKQSWERERFHFTQHLEELQTELSDYKNTSNGEKQKLTILNAYLERKFALQEALTENIQKEKEILERHIPPGVHYHVMNELVDIQTRRSLICTLLNGNIDCHLTNPPTITFPNVTVEQLPMSNRQVVDMNAYLPLDSPSTEMSPGGNGQMLDVYNLSDNKIQYQAFSNEVSDGKEIIDLKEESNSNEGNDIS